MATNFKNLFTKSNRAKRTQPRRSSLKPRFESLEDRRLMTAIIWEGAPRDGQILVRAIGTTESDRITVDSYTATQQIAAPRGVRTIQVPMIKVQIMDAAGSPRFDAAGNPLVRSYEQAKVSQLSLFGDHGNDTITNNTSLPSMIDGEGGNDTIYGGSGDDRIRGDGNPGFGSGQNTIFGRGGNDTIHGGDFTDEIWGGIGDDELHGGGGNDYLHGDDGADHLFGETGSDTLFGGAHNDELFGGMDNDFLFGEAGDDLLVGESGSDYLYGGSHNDILFGGHRNFNVHIAVSNAVFGQSESVWSQDNDAGVDHLWGGDGQDLIYFRMNQDYVDGWPQLSLIINLGPNASEQVKTM